MHMSGIPFGTTDWSLVRPTEHKGETGTAYWHTQQIDTIRVRLVEYSPGYLADHWCTKGHILFCLEGELHTELADGREFVLTPGVSYQVAAFHNHFSQQSVVGSVAGGNLPLAVGESLYVGTEVGGQLDFAPMFDIRSDLFLRLAYTWLPVARTETPFTQVSNGQPVPGSVEGNRLPYAPRNMVTLGLGYNHPVGFSGLVEMVYVSEQYGDFANTVAPSANGQAGLLDA